MNMNIKRLSLNEYYESSDLALVTTISLFQPLEAIDRTNPHKALFIFKRDTHLEKLIEAYWKDEIRVNPREYFNALKSMKARLYSNE